MAMMLEDAGGGGALMLLAVSFIPGIVASSRNQHQQTAVYMLNLLLGWSVLCWIALVWAEFAFPPTINTPGSMASAMALAVILHLVIVLLIAAIDSKKPGAPLEFAGSDSFVNVVLIVFSAAFLALTVLSGDQWDYPNFLGHWIDVLEGRDPWDYAHKLDYTNNYDPHAYGPLFNLLAPLVWLNPLANKLLFAFSYLVFVIWLIKDYGPRRGLVTFSWSWGMLLLLLMNPFPWREIAYLGYFDILVGLACVAALHWQVRSKDWLSGTFLALGILLKFLPIVILPFLACMGRLSSVSDNLLLPWTRRFGLRTKYTCLGNVDIHTTNIRSHAGCAVVDLQSFGVYSYQVFLEVIGLDMGGEASFGDSGPRNIRVVRVLPNWTCTFCCARSLSDFALLLGLVAQLSDGVLRAHIILGSF